MKRTLALSVAAPCCALAILLAACTGGGTAEPADDGQSIDQPAPKPETPAEPDTPDNPADPGIPNDPDNPDNPGEEAPAYKTVKEVLQEILGDDYNDISGEISQNITLTAQTIDAVTDIFPVLESVTKASDKDAEDKKMNEAKTKVKASTNDVKRALVAQAEDKITLTKEAKEYKGISGSTGNILSITGSEYKISAEKDVDVSLDGKFEYFNNHIELLSDNINIFNVTISSTELNGKDLLIPAEELTKEIYNKLNLKGKDNNNLPTLDFELTKTVRDIAEIGIGVDFGLRHFWDIYSKYNEADKLYRLGKLSKEIPFTEIDGRALVADEYIDSYTLFKGDGNDVKTSKDDKDIKYFDVNELATFTNRYNISNIRNLIISGTPTSNITVNWDLTNIIFETDMSNLKNISKKSLTGIIYFKNYPYNNKEVISNGGSLDAYGIVKLDKLSYTFGRNSTTNSVLDVRGVDKDEMNSYNSEKGILAGGGKFVYLNKDFWDLAKDYEGKYKADFYGKFTDTAFGGIESEYFGDNGIRQDSFGPKQGLISSMTPRKLKDFEYYGNNIKYPTAARDSYTNEEFKKLSESQQGYLDSDKRSGENKIAKVTTLCPLC